MCSRGLYQLKRLSLFFCDWSSSSVGVRELLVSPDLNAFRDNHKHIDFEFILKRNHHPYFTSTYINGYIKDIPLRCLSKQQILEHFKLCNNSFGRRAISASNRKVIGARESIQGKWYPNMWNNYPKTQMEQLRIVTQPQIPMIDKPLKDLNERKNIIQPYDIMRKDKKAMSDYTLGI